MVVVELEITPNEMLEGSVAWQYDALFPRMHGECFIIDSNNRIIACCSFNARQCGSNDQSVLSVSSRAGLKLDWEDYDLRFRTYRSRFASLRSSLSIVTGHVISNDYRTSKLSMKIILLYCTQDISYLH